MYSTSFISSFNFNQLLKNTGIQVDETLSYYNGDIIEENVADDVNEEVEKVLSHDENATIDEEPDLSRIEEDYEQEGEDNTNKGNVNHRYSIWIYIPWISHFMSCSYNFRLDIDGKNCREEPKAIVFLSKILLLFQFCHLCKHPNPRVEQTQTGTMLTIVTKCSNCLNEYTWSSQPLLLGKFPAGNILLSFAILSAGASVKKVLLVLQHINILVYNQSTYYYHQKHLLIPAIVTFWRSYQKQIFDRLNGNYRSLLFY